jgi:hypothetical protein
MTAMSTGVRFTALYGAWLVTSLTEIRDVISAHAGVNVDEPKAQQHLRRAAPERT